MSTQSTAPTRFLSAESIQYAYRIIGDNNGTAPLLLLNHFRSTIDLWDPVLIGNLTSSGRRVITYDYAGIGHSGGSVANTIKGFSANLISFLRILLPILSISSIDVLGFSLGGYVAQQLVLDAPNLVNKLILSGTGPSLGPGLQRPMAEVQSAIMAAIPEGPPTIAAFFPGVAAEQGVAWLHRSFGGRSEVAGKGDEPKFVSFLTGPGVENLTAAYLGWDADPLPFSLLQTVQKEVLVTAGQNDLVVPNYNAWVLAHQLPHASFVQYPTSGHGHLFQYADVYARQVNDFLDGKWPLSLASAGSV